MLTTYEPNYFDVLRAFGQSDMHFPKVREMYIYYSQKSGEPASYSVTEMAGPQYEKLKRGEVYDE